MKKLLVLSVLLGLMALPMFASDITFGGDATFGFIGDFGDNEAEKVDLTLDVMVAIDDYNSLAISLKGLGALNGTSTIIDDIWVDINDDGVVDPGETITSAYSVPNAVGLDKALASTDVGAWLGLPVGLVVTWGYDDPDANEFEVVTSYENEAVFDFSPTEYWGLGFLLSASMVEVELAFDPGLADTDPGRLLAGLAVKEPIPGLNAEVYYFQNEVIDDLAKGVIGFDAAYSGEFGPVGLKAGAAFAYNLGDSPDAGEEYAFGIGLSAAISMVDLTLGISGDDEDALHTVSASAVAAPVDMLDIYVGMLMDLSDLTNAGEDLQEVDLGINAHVGAVEVYVGYLVTSVGSDERWNSPGVGAPDGGAYIKFDVDY
jgi:hypothetical protein